MSSQPAIDLVNDDVEQTLAMIPIVHVFKIPPRSSSEGYRAEGWMQNKIWTGRCRVIARGLRCEVRLEANDGKPFATCVVNTDKDGPKAVEPVMDSSRYFVLRIEDPNTGRHAFIGIGFEQRTDSFDFNVALQDHQKFVERIKNPVSEEEEGAPAKDYSLRDGETIKVQFKVKTKNKTTDAGINASGSGVSSATGRQAEGNLLNSGGGFNLGGPSSSAAAPAAAGGLGGLLPPPPSAQRRVPGGAPAQAGSGQAAPRPAGGALFDF